MKRGFLLCSLCFLWPSFLQASPEKAQRLLEARKPQEALEIVRADLVRHPRNLIAQYNYAVGAYAAGIYSGAIDTLTSLAGVADPEMGLRSQFQLGNAHFRRAEQMLGENPAGAVLGFEESVKRFAYAAGQPGEYQLLAQTNLKLSHEQAAGAYLRVAREHVARGDKAARIKTEEGFPGWEASLEFFDKAQVHQPENTKIPQEKKVIVDRIAKESFIVAGRLLQQGRMHERYVIERAITVFRDSIAFFEKSAKYGKAEGLAGATEAKGALAGALLKLVAEQQAVAEKEMTRSAAVSLEALGKATRNLAEAEQLGVDPVAHAAAQAPMSDLWARAHAARGDEQVAEGAQNEREGKTVEQLNALVSALASYDQSLRYRPDHTETLAKRDALRLRLSDLYEGEGRRLLELAKATADTNLEEALASAEKSIQSFQRAITYNAQNESAKAGLAEAKALYDELRARQKKDDRKTAKKSKDEMKEPKDLKNLPKDLALKLLDYRNNNPATKNPQLLTAPENRALQDW